MIPTATPDLYGLALLDYLGGCHAPVHLRRDDGWLSALHLGPCFDELAAFAPHERILVERAAGQVLDLGAGAGRLGLHLRSRTAGRRGPGSLAVTSVDRSPGACECLRRRGLEPVHEACWQDMTGAAQWRQRWDSIFMLGAGVGMAGTAAGLDRLCAALASWLKPDGFALLAATGPPSGEDLRSLRLRVEYRGLIGEWFSWLLVSPTCLANRAAAVGLRVEGDPHHDQDDDYGIILCRRQTEEA